jgi:hypothetical protein
MNNEFRSAGLRPAVEAASRRLIERNEFSQCWQGFGGGRDPRRTAGETPALQGAYPRSVSMMLVLSLIVGLVPLAGIARIVMNGSITTVDGLFMSIIMLALSGILFLNVYLEARKKFILKKAPQAQKTS